MGTGRGIGTLAWGVPAPGLFPLLLLSKLVSKLDVLPDSLKLPRRPPPPPVLPTHRRPGAKAGLGTRGKGLELLLSTITDPGEAEMIPTQADPGLGKSLGWEL